MSICDTCMNEDLHLFFLHLNIILHHVVPADLLALTVPGDHGAFHIQQDRLWKNANCGGLA